MTAPIEPGVVLTVDGVTKSFAAGAPWRRRHVEVLRGADLQVSAGELVGLVGENGSGKSTLMEIIVGLLARDGGDVTVAGRLGYCPQLPLLWEKLTVAEHFELFARAYELSDESAPRFTRCADGGARLRALPALPR